MPLKFAINRKFSFSSDRVKSVDIHPTEPLLLAGLYTGFIQLWNFESNRLEKTFEVTESANVPVRSAKFIARKQWFVCCSDDMYVRVFDYNTLRKIKQWGAHQDYCRCVVVHPSKPLILSCSDDTLIKAWDWTQNFSNTITFKGHGHYVMQIAVNPRNLDQIASASLDKTILFWSLSSPEPFFSLKGHEKGVNCLCFSGENDRPFLVSGGDDSLVKIWDYISKQCLVTLSGHFHNISAVSVHTKVPVIISASEDGTMRIWHSNTFRLETSLDYGLDRVWTTCPRAKGNKVAAGFDYGCILLQLGNDCPVASMDAAGNVIWFDDYTLRTVCVKNAQKDQKDNSLRFLKTVELGPCEVYPQFIQHSPNGRAICVLGSENYTISTAKKLKSISFGTAREFAWSFDSKIFATRENDQQIKIFFEYKERKTLTPTFPAEEMFGGSLLAICSAENTDFFDWLSLKLVKRLSHRPKRVFWSDCGSKVALLCGEETLLYIFDQTESKFIFCRRFKGEIISACFVKSDCFIFLAKEGDLKYFVTGEDNKNGEIFTVAQTEDAALLLGVLEAENALFLMDRDNRIYSFYFNFDVVDFQKLVLSNNENNALEILQKIPKEEHSKLVQFLEAQNHLPIALELSKDCSQKFRISLKLNKIDIAKEMAAEINTKSAWQKLGKKALENCEFELFEQCCFKTDDFGSLLLLYLNSSNFNGLKKLEKIAKERKIDNIVFSCLLHQNKIEEAISILTNSELYAEAALMAKTYFPSIEEKIIEKWNFSNKKFQVKKIFSKENDEKNEIIQNGEIIQNYSENSKNYNVEI